MRTEEWEKISELLERALALRPEEREPFLAEIATIEGFAVQEELRALLRADQDSTGFLKTDAMTAAADALAREGETDVRPGMVFGGYKILTSIGAGGMGEVYLAQNESLHRRAALKFPPFPLMGNDAQQARFEREARAAGALNHPNILTIYEIGNAHGRSFLATEYIEGKTLRALIGERTLTPKEILQIATQLTGALDAAHRAGLIHRDIKPENIMVRSDGLVKLLDFGLARSADEIEAIPQIIPPNAYGTPRYMSPEQARGERLDGRADLWSLGATLYEMIAGKPLIAGSSLIDAFKEILDPKPIELRLGTEQRRLQALLEKALAKDRDHRWKNAQEFGSEIEKILKALDRTDSKPFHKSDWKWWGGAALVLWLVFLAAWGFRNRIDATRPNPSEIGSVKFYWDLNDAERDGFLALGAERIGRMLAEEMKPASPRSLAQIKTVLDQVASKRNSLSTDPGQESPKSVYARASVYAPFISDAFRARKLPPILGLYVAMAETEYQPCWGSAVGGRGLFGFLTETAERYGLKLAPEDERCDPRKMALAAADYFDDLTRTFRRSGDEMTLAVVAYNAGETRIARFRDELLAKGIHADSFWIIIDNEGLLTTPIPMESRLYLPRFFAFAIIGEFPEHFGLDIQRLSSYTKAL